jgi:hypothetical protein
MVRHLFSIDINSTGAGLKNLNLGNGSLTGEKAQ